MILDKGLVINADIAITVGDTEMIGIELRAAIASFDTAAEYGLAFPSGTDMEQLAEASGRELEGEPVDLGIEASSGGESLEQSEADHPSRRPGHSMPLDDDEETEAQDDDEETEADEE